MLFRSAGEEIYCQQADCQTKGKGNVPFLFLLLLAHLYESLLLRSRFLFRIPQRITKTVAMEESANPMLQNGRVSGTFVFGRELLLLFTALDMLLVLPAVPLVPLVPAAVPLVPFEVPLLPVRVPAPAFLEVVPLPEGFVPLDEALEDVPELEEGPEGFEELPDEFEELLLVPACFV